MYLRPNYRMLFILIGVATTLILLAVLVLALRPVPVDNEPPSPQAIVTEGVLEERGGHFFVEGYRLTGAIDRPQALRAVGYKVRVAGTTAPGVVAGEIKIMNVLNMESLEEIHPRKGWVWYASKDKPFFVIAAPEELMLAPARHGTVTYMRSAKGGEDAVYFELRASSKDDPLDPPPGEDGFAYADLKTRPATGTVIVGGYLYDEVGDEATRLIRPSKSCEAQPHCPRLTIEARPSAYKDINTIIQSIAFAPRFSGWQVSTFAPQGTKQSVRFQYPPEWHVREEGVYALRVIGSNENETVRFIAAPKIEKSREPYLAGSEALELPTIKYGTLYRTHDEVGNSVDRFIFKLTDGTYEIEIQGSGAIFEALLRSLEIVR